MKGILLIGISLISITSFAQSNLLIKCYDRDRYAIEVSIEENELKGEILRHGQVAHKGTVVARINEDAAPL